MLDIGNGLETGGKAFGFGALWQKWGAGFDIHAKYDAANIVGVFIHKYMINIVDENAGDAPKWPFTHDNDPLIGDAIAGVIAL